MPTTRRRLARWTSAATLSLALLASAATPASAQPKKDLDDPLLEADGRLRGYDVDTTAMDESSTFLAYLLLIGVGAAAVGVMFKNARRTHLD